jgi:hypothetical protein
MYFFIEKFKKKEKKKEEEVTWVMGLPKLV